MNSISSLPILLILYFVLASCTETIDEGGNTPKTTELNDFKTIVSSDKMVLANPQRIRYDDREEVIIFDSGLEKVVRLSLDGEVIHEIGSKGSGPGEYQSVSNIYL